MKGARAEELSTKANFARDLLSAGAPLAGFMALIFLGFSAVFLSTTGREFGMVPVALLPFGFLILFGVLAVAGVIETRMATRRVLDEARQAGVLGVVAAFSPPTHLFSLARRNPGDPQPGSQAEELGMNPMGRPSTPFKYSRVFERLDEPGRP